MSENKTLSKSQDIHSGKVIDLSSEGWGVVKSDTGLVCFVAGVWIGDEIEFEIIQRGKFLKGKVLSWLHKSVAHRESPCAHWGLEAPKCGACAWMNIHYEAQIAAKELKIKNTLARFKLVPEEILPMQQGPEFAYRNRVKLSQKNSKIGYQVPMSHEIAEIKKCLVAEDWINEKIQEIFLAPPKENEIWIQKAKGSAFAQGNTLLNEKMRSSLAQLLPNEEFIALELFCGDGNFSEIICSKARQVYAYESNASAVSALQARFKNIKALTLDLYAQRSIKELSKHRESQLLVLDPPRSGYKELSSLVDNLQRLEKIIYVSCDPMTFARDVSALRGWTFKKLLSFDLFPQTPHIELMGYWERNV